jgi:hypothetical protein
MPPARKWAFYAAFAFIALAACTTVLLVSALKPVSTYAFLSLVLWLFVPYVIMSAALSLLHRKGKTSLRWGVAAMIVSAGGILALVDVIYWHPDAQGAIAVLMVPILQIAALALLLPIFWMLRTVRT